MRRVLWTAAILALNLIFQSYVMPFFKIRGIIPNTALVIIISFSLLRGSFEGCLTGFGAGLLQDIFFGNSLGYYALLGTLTGYLCGKFNHGFFRENYATPVILSAVAAIVYETAVYITGFLFAGNLHYLHFLLNLILPEAVYTAIVTFVIYRILFSINDHIENKDKYKRKLFTIK